MKRLTALILMAIMLSFVFPGVVAVGEENQGAPHGYVLCETLTLRSRASSSSRALRTLTYGTEFTVLDNEPGYDVDDEWYPVQVKFGRKTVKGYVSSEYVILDPEMYTAKSSTPVYAYASKDAKRVGLLSRNSKAIIIQELEDYYIISLRTAVGFVRK